MRNIGRIGELIWFLSEPPAGCLETGGRGRPWILAENSPSLSCSPFVYLGNSQRETTLMLQGPVRVQQHPTGDIHLQKTDGPPSASTSRPFNSTVTTVARVARFAASRLRGFDAAAVLMNTN